jgi:hypothetical protein
MLRRTLKLIGLLAAIVILAAIGSAYALLRASLPTLDGTLATRALSSAVAIERDGLGIPTVWAANRSDLAYGTGFVHGQDRFFQMDLLRRLAAGELSELFGAVALEQDKNFPFPPPRSNGTQSGNACATCACFGVCGGRERGTCKPAQPPLGVLASGRRTHAMACGGLGTRLVCDVVGFAGRRI